MAMEDAFTIGAPLRRNYYNLSINVEAADVEWTPLFIFILSGQRVDG